MMPTLVVIPNASNIHPYTRQDLHRAFVIIDAQRVSGVQLNALADYVAMVTLAQVDANADLSQAHTILNLFAGGALNPEAPMSLTDWDRAYLRGLYSADRHAATSAQQRGQIVDSMQRDGTTAATP